MYNMNHKTFAFTGIWEQAFGQPERNGAWLIWGKEKQGKTWLALMLAHYLSSFGRVLYVSAEEGLSKNLVDTCMRIGIDASSKMRMMDYTAMDELEAILAHRRAPQVVVIDNLTVYNDELKYGAFMKLLRTHESKLFIFLAHEENKQPYTISAKLCSRYAKVRVHTQGLAAFVTGRCPGGVLHIDEQKAQLYWGVNHTANDTH